MKNFNYFYSIIKKERNKEKHVQDFEKAEPESYRDKNGD